MTLNQILEDFLDLYELFNGPNKDNQPKKTQELYELLNNQIDLELNTLVRECNKKPNKNE
jgi:hypothetical protein